MKRNVAGASEDTTVRPRRPLVVVWEHQTCVHINACASSSTEKEEKEIGKARRLTSGKSGQHESDDTPNPAMHARTHTISAKFVLRVFSVYIYLIPTPQANFRKQTLSHWPVPLRFQVSVNFQFLNLLQIRVAG